MLNFDTSAEDDIRAEILSALAGLADHVDVIAQDGSFVASLTAHAARCKLIAPAVRHRLATIAEREGRSPTPPPPEPPPPLAARVAVPPSPAADAATPEWATAGFRESVYASRRAAVQRVSHGGRAVEPIVSRAADDTPENTIDPVDVYARRAAVVAGR
jgi:hypothetical protein